MSELASITVRRRVEWSDTDAAGIYHWLTAFRLVEAAEAELHDRLRIRRETFGRMPRASASADFRAPLRFFDAADVELRVTAVGRSSVGYAFTVSIEGTLAVEGSLVAVFVDAGIREGALTLPDHIRQRLLTGGPQQADC